MPLQSVALRTIPDVHIPLPGKDNMIRGAVAKPEKIEAIVKHQTRMK